ncbi:terminase small subunit [Geminisphaera colitermitum]|uniref:terminase small subunit n=1 Tax=Geminisphaera colitermitum TaxID=1148786 RepID=UPI000158CDBA|nr:terminase small subunit [Geminisphaera colitermitum]
MTPEPDKQQLKFTAIEAAFVASGVGEIPQGASDLTKREMTFVLRMLEHGQMAQAAIEAGYSEASAASIASETLKKPKVFAFYRRCLDKVVTNAERLTARVYERSVVLHAQALEAAQKLAEANEWLLLSERHESGKNAKDVREFELARERAQRDQKHFIGLANQTDALLGSLLGKIVGITINNQTNFSIVGDADRAHLLELQRELSQGLTPATPSLAGIGGERGLAP